MGNALIDRDVMPNESTLDAMKRIIEAISRTGAYPKWILTQIKDWCAAERNNGGIVKETEVIKKYQPLIDANLLLCAMYGWTLRIPLLVALYNISISNGMPIIETKMMTALIYRDCPQAEIQQISSTDKECIVKARRHNNLDWAEFKTTWDDISKAGYDKKNGSLYKTIPTIMIRWRTYANMARILFPDVLMGFYVEGEIMEDDPPQPLPKPVNQIEGHEIPQILSKKKFTELPMPSVEEKPIVSKDHEGELEMEYNWDEPIEEMQKTFETTVIKKAKEEKQSAKVAPVKSSFITKEVIDLAANGPTEDFDFDIDMDEPEPPKIQTPIKQEKKPLKLNWAYYMDCVEGNEEKDLCSNILESLATEITDLERVSYFSDDVLGPLGGAEYCTMRDAVEVAITNAFTLHKMETNGEFDPLKKRDEIIAIAEERVKKYNMALLEFFVYANEGRPPLEVINDWIGKYTKSQQVNKTPVYENLTRYVPYFIELLKFNDLIA